MAPEIKALLPYFVNFAIVIAILVASLRKPLRKYVYQRHERMRDAIEAAAIAHQKAAARAAAARQALASLSQEESELLQRESHAATVESREVLAKARAEVLRITLETDRLAGAEQTEALDRVKVQFLDLVMHQAEEGLKNGLKKDDHRAIIRRAQNSIEVGV